MADKPFTFQGVNGKLCQITAYRKCACPQSIIRDGIYMVHVYMYIRIAIITWPYLISATVATATGPSVTPEAANTTGVYAHAS